MRIVLPFRFTLPFDMFANTDIISRILAPCTIVHGTRDEVVPFKHGLELSKKMRRLHHPFWIDGGGHNNLEVEFYDAFYSHIREFLDYLKTAPLPEDLVRQASESTF